MALAEFIVAFREIFEVALVLGIMLAYLKKTRNARHERAVYAGAGLAVLASLLAAFAFESFAGGFERNEALFEGITLVLAALMVTWLNLWVLAQKEIRKGIERKLSASVEKEHWQGIAALAFVAVFREGVEIVLFLGGIAISSGALNLASALAGAAAALALGYAVFRQFLRLDLAMFFKITFVLLTLLAAGLLSQGVHELQEAGVVPVSIERLYDITPPQNADGSYPLLHEKGAVGGLLRGLVGYDTSPSLEQVAAYFGYLLLVYAAYLHICHRRGDRS